MQLMIKNLTEFNVKLQKKEKEKKSDINMELIL